jgi:hypothetical protein
MWCKDSGRLSQHNQAGAGRIYCQFEAGTRRTVFAEREGHLGNGIHEY